MRGSPPCSVSAKIDAKHLTQLTFKIEYLKNEWLLYINNSAHNASLFENLHTYIFVLQMPSVPCAKGLLHVNVQVKYF